MKPKVTKEMHANMETYLKDKITGYQDALASGTIENLDHKTVAYYLGYKAGFFKFMENTNGISNKNK